MSIAVKKNAKKNQISNCSKKCNSNQKKTIAKAKKVQAITKKREVVVQKVQKNLEEKSFKKEK